MTEVTQAHNRLAQDLARWLRWLETMPENGGPAPRNASDISSWDGLKFQHFSRALTLQLPRADRVSVGAVKLSSPPKEMSSLVQKLRSLLEASWAMSPTMVGLACLTLDLAALLHLRMKTTQPPAAETVRKPGAGE